MQRISYLFSPQRLIHEKVMLILKFQNKRDLIKYRSTNSMILPFFLIRYSSLPNLKENNFKSSDFAYFCRLVNHLFELETRTIVLDATCDERLRLTSEVNWPCISSLISWVEVLIKVLKMRQICLFRFR